jgi:hypothetical protein
MLSDKSQKKVFQFVYKYLNQMFNSVFAVILNPTEALDFLYERIYFTYSSDKNLLTNNIKKLENLYQNNSESKIRTILKITRPMVKINYLLHADQRILSILNLQEIDSNNLQDTKMVTIAVDRVMSKLISDLFMYKKNSSNYTFDQVAFFVNKQIDDILEYSLENS